MIHSSERLVLLEEMSALGSFEMILYISDILNNILKKPLSFKSTVF